MALTDHERYLNALAKPFEGVEEIAAEEGTEGEPGWVPAWGKLLDVQLCPAKDLPYLAQYVGVVIPTGASEAEARELVKIHSGFSRGTLASLEALLKKALGTVPFYVLERSKEGVEDPYFVTILIPTGHVGGPVDEEINKTIPAGIFYEIVERAGTWFSGTRTWETIVAGKKWTEMTEGNF